MSFIWVKRVIFKSFLLCFFAYIQIGIYFSNGFDMISSGSDQRSGFDGEAIKGVPYRYSNFSCWRRKDNRSAHSDPSH